MSHLNVELKARCDSLEAPRAVLVAAGARCVGTDHQVDLYYPCAHGRFKLREGTIEHALIHYERPNVDGIKPCAVTMTRLPAEVALADVLTAALGEPQRVAKVREIWYLDNVKIHLDRVDPLGTFLEIEALDLDGTRGEAALRAQCEELMARLGVDRSQLLALSYSDLL